MREAMGVEIKGRTLGGEGNTVEIDADYFGSCVKPTNLNANRIDPTVCRMANRSAGSPATR
jgi:hypothetical protein